MREPKDGLILYHGSYCEVKEPDLTKCSKRKDFGQGFYLTSSKEQAESFLKTSIAKAVAAGKIADDFCIKQLLPNKLKDQYCFKTNSAIECLKFIESEKIWLK